jgi:ArsR family transcriptional regulator, arsenate/arsenite/antimonite-responsive transcriptional repressor
MDRNIIQYMLNYSDSTTLNDPPVNLVELSKWFKVFSEPKRLLIFDLLMQGVQCNCELGETLNMAPNLISHHLSILRKAGLVEVERDAIDSRWVYYSVNQKTLQELNRAFGDFFDPERIKPRRPTCGPGGALVSLSDIQVSEA